MKLFITLFIVICCDAVRGQDTVKFTKQDSIMYGTPGEKTQQEAIERQSDSRFLCRLIGFKQYYINEIETFVQSGMEFSAEDNSPIKKGYIVDLFTKNGVFTGSKPPKLLVSFTINKSDRITSVIINSKFSYLAFLFIKYWPQSADWVSEVKLKPGVVARKHSFGDLVTFNWSGTTPFIKITKDPNISFPVGK